MKTVVLFMLIFFPSTLCEAGFGFWGSPKTTGSVQTSEFEHYRIHMATNGRRKNVFDREGKKETWVQVEYKFVGLAPHYAELFDASEWLVIRFEDKKGFVLSSDAFKKRELDSGHSYFGFFWTTLEKSKRIKVARVRKEIAERIDAVLLKNREINALIQKVNDLEAGVLQVAPVQEVVFPETRRPVTDEAQGVLVEGGEDPGEEDQAEPYDPFDDPDRIRNDTLGLELKQFLDASVPDDTENLPVIPESITSEDVTLYNAEISEPAKPKLEFV